MRERTDRDRIPILTKIRLIHAIMMSINAITGRLIPCLQPFFESTIHTRREFQG